MMEQMETSFDDLDGNESFGFDDLSLEQYRQDLLEEFNKDKDKYLNMPKGVYTGFNADSAICAKNGIIALLGYPARPAQTSNYEYKLYDLIYINGQGNSVLMNQKEVLDALTLHKDYVRYVPDDIDNGNPDAIQKLADTLRSWMDKQASEEQKQEDGTVKKMMGKEAKDLLAKLQKGDKDAVVRIKQNTMVNEKFKIDNFDLITWFIVS